MLPVRPWLPVAAVGITLVLWASAFVAIRYLGDDFSPGALSLGRLLVGSLALGIVAVGRGGLVRPTGAQWRSLVLIGVLWFGIYNVALNEGERHVDAGTAAMLIQISPVLLAVLAVLFLGESFGPYLVAGLAVAFLGVCLIGTASPGEGQRDLLGVGLCLLSALVYSISVVLQKPLMATIPGVQVTWLACTVGMLCTLPFLPSLVTQVQDAPVSSSLWLVYLGLFPTAIAFTTYAYALKYMTASSLGVTTYLVPPITIVMGLLFLSETPEPIAYAGGVLALLGVTLARRTRRTPAAGPLVDAPADSPAAVPAPRHRDPAP